MTWTLREAPRNPCGGLFLTVRQTESSHSELFVFSSTGEIHSNTRGQLRIGRPWRSLGAGHEFRPLQVRHRCNLGTGVRLKGETGPSPAG